MKAFTSRVKAAWEVITKGSIAPFDRIGIVESFSTGKLTQAYRNSPWVQRAIKKVAGPIAAVSLQFRSVGGSDLISDPDLQAFWNRPAVGMTRSDFIEASVCWLKLRGEFFWLLDDRALSYRNAPFPEALEPGQKFQPMIVARPDRMEHMVQDGRLEGWRFTDGAGKRHLLTTEQVLHCKLFNPYDEWRGMAEMDAAMPAAEADYLAGKYNLHLMRNNGDQGPFIIAKNGIPTEPQRAQIIEQLREKKELGLKGIFKAAFLTGDITVEDPKVQAVDAAMLASRLQNRHEIFLTFGVPPSMADKMESYSVGSASDWYILIFETCVPTAEKIAASIAQTTKMQGGQELEVGFNWREHPVIQAVIRERIDSACKLWDKGMPMEQANEYLDLGLPEYPGWNAGFLPFGLAPIAEVQSGETDPARDEDFSEQEDAEEKTKGLKGQKGRKGREQAQWQKQMVARQPIIKAFQVKFNRELMAARTEILQKLKTVSLLTSGKAYVTKAAAADFMFSLHDFTEGLKAAMRNQAGAALQSAGEQVYEELRRDDPWKTAPEEVLNFFRTRENKIVDVAQEVFSDVRDNLQEGVDAGESIDDLSKRVREQFTDMSHERSKRIAMTETAAAFGTGRQEAMERAGITQKKWLTSGNENVRAAHRSANGQVVGIDEAFEVGGEQLMHPGDPSGSPENTINCHCVAIPIA